MDKINLTRLHVGGKIDILNVIKMSEEYVQKMKSMKPTESLSKLERIRNRSKNQLYSDDEMISMFAPEYAGYLDSKGNNIPMIAIQSDRRDLAVKLIAADVFNVNHRNAMGKTIFYYAFSYRMISFCIQLITLYEYKDFNIFGNKSVVEMCLADEKYMPLLPYLVANKYKKTVVDKLTIYPKEFFDPKKFKIEGSGGYGTVVTSKGIDGNIYALKISQDECDAYMPTDFFKEMMISRIINKKFPKTIGEIYGYYPETQALVMEYLPLTLKSILTSNCSLAIEYKTDLMKELFRSIIESVRNINSCGFCHFDLKPANIMVDENGQVRIIDLGLSGFIGLEPVRFIEFFQSWEVKGPDDPSEIVKYYFDDEEIFVKEKEESYSVNYSTDMYAIASMMLGMIMDTPEPHQMLCTRNNIYVYKKTNSLTVDVEIMPDHIRDDMDKFSPHLFDFFVRCFCTNSNLRMTTFEALNHPLFCEETVQKDMLPYSISEVRIEREYENFISPEEQIMLMNGSLKAFERFKDVYSNLKIPPGSTNLDADIEFDDDNVEIILTSERLDMFLNYSLYERMNGQGDMTSDFENLSACLESCISNRVISKTLNEKIIKNIMASDIIFIPFKSIIMAYITSVRLNGMPPNKISILIKNIVKSLLHAMFRDSSQIDIMALIEMQRLSLERH